MKLLNVEIENYRSIKEMMINFEYNTKIFVGLSETGKSNILKALYTLKSSQKTSNRDIREDMELTDSSYIEFSFQLEKEDKDRVTEMIEEKIYGGDVNSILLDGEKKKVKIDYLLNRNYFYFVNVKSGVKYCRSYRLDDKSYSINDDYCIVKGTKENPIEITDNADESNKFSIEDKVIVNKTIFNISTDTSETFKIEDYNSFITNIINDYLKNHEFNVLFWKYDESNILPSEINTEDFVNNPDKCIPLKKIFELYGIQDIKKEYDLRKSTTRANSFDNLLTKISRNVTSYFRKKWVTMPKDTQIIISESGENMRIAIKDSENKFDMSDRSDGYKRLISFIILISIDNTQSKLKNALLLIDCPEAEIDIPGQKYLRDELIEIGKNNYVFYSTHSPYMIDSSNIYRHYIVDKNKEITSIKISDEANYNDSSILFNALGASLFENVCDVNLALEGWTDKQLFNIGQRFLTAQQKNKIEEFGLCHLGGLRNVNAFASTWQLICRVKKYVIISDSDEVAKQIKNRFCEEHLNDNVEWLTYEELANTTRIIETAEDFLQPSHIKSICDLYVSNKGEGNEIDTNKLIDDTKPKLKLIEEWLKQYGYEKEEYRTEKNKLKEMLFTSINKTHIRDEYKNVLINIKDRFCG